MLQLHPCLQFREHAPTNCSSLYLLPPLGRMQDFLTGGWKLGVHKNLGGGPGKLLKSGMSETQFSGGLGYILGNTDKKGGSTSPIDWTPPTLRFGPAPTKKGHIVKAGLDFGLDFHFFWYFIFLVFWYYVITYTHQAIFGHKPMAGVEPYFRREICVQKWAGSFVNPGTIRRVTESWKTFYKWSVWTIQRSQSGHITRIFRTRTCHSKIDFRWPNRCGSGTCFPFGCLPATVSQLFMVGTHGWRHRGSSTSSNKWQGSIRYCSRVHQVNVPLWSFGPCNWIFMNFKDVSVPQYRTL